MDQTAKHVPPFDRRLGRPTGLRCSGTGGYGQAQSPMWSLLEVVGNVGLEHALEVPTPVDQEMVEALTAHGPHEPLRECIRPRRADRRSDDADALGPEHRVERSRELGVPVAHEEAHTRQALLDGEVPRLLGDPGGVGVLGHAGQANPPRRELDEEQDVERLAPDRLDGEEVGREDPRRL
jgi:hypothetical protein